MLGTIQAFRTNARPLFFTVGMNDKANRIEKAMCDVPLAQRGKIFEKDQGDLVMKVKEELGSHRHFHKQRYYKDPLDRFDEKKAARSFTDLKKRFAPEQNTEEAAPKNEHGDSHAPK